VPKYEIAEGRKITLDSDTDKERTYAHGDVVDMPQSKAAPFVEEGTLYPEGSPPPVRALEPNEFDPGTGLLASGEATADTPAVLLAPPVQVGALWAEYVPGEPVPDESNPPPSASTDPTVDDLTPEQVEALTPPEQRVDVEETTPFEERPEVAPVETVQEDRPADDKER
jgi:hypothetical protein